MDPQNITPPVLPPVSSRLLIVAVILILLVTVSSVSWYLGSKTSRQEFAPSLTPKAIPTIPTPFIVQSPTISPSPRQIPSQMEEMKTITVYSFFTLDIPRDWNAAFLWSTNSQGGDTIALDPLPITTAPRDGPLATFTFLEKNGLQKPEQTFYDDIQKAKKDFTLQKEETFENNGITFIHLRSLIEGPYLSGYHVEKYFFMLPRTNDPMNTQVIEATYIEPQNGENLTTLLRQVILSIKKI